MTGSHAALSSRHTGQRLVALSADPTSAGCGTGATLQTVWGSRPSVAAAGRREGGSSGQGLTQGGKQMPHRFFGRCAVLLAGAAMTVLPGLVLANAAAQASSVPAHRLGCVLIGGRLYLGDAGAAGPGLRLVVCDVGSGRSIRAATVSSWCCTLRTTGRCTRSSGRALVCGRPGGRCCPGVTIRGQRPSAVPWRAGGCTWAAPGLPGRAPGPRARCAYTR